MIDDCVSRILYLGWVLKSTILEIGVSKIDVYMVVSVVTILLST